MRDKHGRSIVGARFIFQHQVAGDRVEVLVRASYAYNSRCVDCGGVHYLVWLDVLANRKVAAHEHIGNFDTRQHAISACEQAVAEYLSTLHLGLSQTAI